MEVSKVSLWIGTCIKSNVASTPTDRVIASSSSPAVAGPVCYAPYTLWMEAGFHMHAHNLRNICRGFCTLVHSLQRFSGWYVHGVNLMGKNHMDMFYMGNHMDMFYMGKNHMDMFYMGNHMDMCSRSACIMSRCAALTILRISVSTVEVFDA